MRPSSLPRLTLLCWLIAGLALGSRVVSAAPQSDVSDAMARATLEEIKQKYGLDLPFFALVLSKVPVLKAAPPFLREHGSSIGIYLHGRVYVSESLFKPDGAINVDSGTSLAILVHESWHAYYDLLLPESQKTALNQEFRSYYNRNGKYPEEEVICFGDEAIGNYYADLLVAYAFAVRKLLQTGTLSERMLKLYTSSFEGRNLYGYGTNGALAPFPISAYERRTAQQIAADVFPPPEKLLEALRERFPSSPPANTPAPNLGEPARPSGPLSRVGGGRSTGSMLRPAPWPTVLGARYLPEVTQ